MAATPAKLYRGTATTTLTTAYTAPSATTAILTNLIVSNTTSSAATVSIQVDGFYLMKQSPVPPNGMLALDLSQVIPPSSTIKVQASVATAVDVHASGVEVT
ncbi:hypothetical protein [Streptomyces sp. NBC_01198]|uniref:hypothetical protein n=1 Tax=Streptomyces sp. NBC_01198 TaxID=2903769 RepID=UPI002E0F73BC|nr:hypothetical protein OG702_31995 [Streptomyces sp. NBC_01198]